MVGCLEASLSSKRSLQTSVLGMLFMNLKSKLKELLINKLSNEPRTSVRAEVVTRFEEALSALKWKNRFEEGSEYLVTKVEAVDTDRPAYYSLQVTVQPVDAARLWNSDLPSMESYPLHEFLQLFECSGEISFLDLNS